MKSRKIKETENVRLLQVPHFLFRKPFTPFQWAPMCTAEEYTRRAHLVNDEFKAQLNRKSLKI